MKSFLSSIPTLVSSNQITNHMTLGKMKEEITMQLALKLYVITKQRMQPITFTKEVNIILH